jgi:hypothetical protein
MSRTSAAKILMRRFKKRLAKEDDFLSALGKSEVALG